MSPARLVQTASFLLFAVLLYLATFPLISGLPVDVFLRMDPAAGVAAAAAGGAWIAAFAPALLAVAVTAVLGRFFCGWICPLGATLDATDRWVGKGDDTIAKTGANGIQNSLRPMKYQVLLALLVCALLGVSLVFLVSPMALATRFYGLLVHAMLATAVDTVLGWVRPVAQSLDWNWIVYADPRIPHFSSQAIAVILMGMILAAGRLSPRFWCRCLCPAGALFALAAMRPLLRRTVSDACIECGHCQRRCPMGAIGIDPRQTHHGECIVCQNCVRICPTRAISFRWRPTVAPLPAEPKQIDRRRAAGAAVAGSTFALLAMIDPTWPRTGSKAVNGQAAGVLRPPGALPETDFMRRCIGCGLCMKTCPTNALQPAGLETGIAGLFTPRVAARIGACEPRCNACGQVCPTGAIRPLPLEEKTRAKIGTAFILRHKCIAWEMNRPCLVCDEVCPYDAVALRRIPELAVAVPFVDETRCSGCGLCHHHCPVGPASAIVVEPVGALRLAHGSYVEASRRAGLTLELRPSPSTLPPAPEPEHGLPPGFTP